MRPSRLHRADHRRQQLADLVGADAADQRQPAGLVLRIEDVDQPQQLVRLWRRAAFEAERILDAAAELDMGVIGLAGAVADPDHVAGGRVPVAGPRRIPRASAPARSRAAAPRGWCRNRWCASSGWLSRSSPQACMKPSASEMRSASSVIAPRLRLSLIEAEHPLMHAGRDWRSRRGRRRAAG